MLQAQFAQPLEKADNKSAALGRLGLLAALYLSAVGVMLWLARPPFAYPLDDSYIHLAVARTLATSGVWGIGPADPSSPSSSPLWTSILAVAYLGWPHRWDATFVYVPLLLNILFGCGLLRLVSRCLEETEWPSLGILILLIAIPLPVISLIGMEHTLHALLATAFACAGARAVSDFEPSYQVGHIQLGILSALTVACRYETLFVAAPIVLLALLRRRFGVALSVCTAALAVTLGFGAYLVAHGGWLLPNSILLKGAQVGSSNNLIAPVLANIKFILHESRTSATHVIVAAALLLAALAAVIWRREWRMSRWHMKMSYAMALIGLSATAVHFALAWVGWLYRYEAYLIAIDLLALLLLIDEFTSSARLKIATLGLLTLLAVPRGAGAALMTVQSIDDRRLEHLLPAHFVSEFYRDKTIAVNDVGAVAYFGGARVLDLYGLASNEPLRLRRAAKYDAHALAGWAAAEHVSIAIVQACWSEVRSRLPPEWSFVALWRVPRNVIFHDRVVAFFALKKEEVDHLKSALLSFPTPPSIELQIAAWPETAAGESPSDQMARLLDTSCF